MCKEANAQDEACRGLFSKGTCMHCCGEMKCMRTAAGGFATEEATCESVLC